MKRLTTRGKDPAAIAVPKQSLAGFSKSLTAELIHSRGYTAETISAHSSLKFDWNCAVCKGRIKKVSVATRVRGIIEARGSRGCYICARRASKRRRPRRLSDELKLECLAEKGMTPVRELMSNTPEHRLWTCNSCAHLFTASVPARCGEKHPQGCPNCFASDDESEIVDLVNFAELTNKGKPYSDLFMLKTARNRGYNPLKIRTRLPVRHNVFWKCSRGHIRYACFKKLLKKGGCLTCYDEENHGKSLAHSDFKVLHDQFVCVVGLPTFEPQDVPAYASRFVIEWQCQVSEHHSWRTAVERRTRTLAGCPYCAHKRVAAAESLARSKPYKKIALDWNFDKNIHPTKNRPVTPDEVLPSCPKLRDWTCPKRHEYQASCRARTEKGVGCFACLVLPNSLHETYPAVAAQWDKKQNLEYFKELTPYNVTAGSQRRIHWLCNKGSKKSPHAWEAVVSRRTHGGNGCPHCDGKTAIKENTLKGKYPQLKPHYHSNKKRNQKTFSDAPAGLDQKHWWACFGCRRPYKRTVRSMLHLERGPGCVECRRARHPLVGQGKLLNKKSERVLK